jgi:predicted Zn-dependent peptidase
MTRLLILRNRAVTTAFAVATMAMPAGAQARPKEPVVKPAATYVFPKVQTRTLPNGLVVQIVEDHALPLVAVRTVIEGGALLDPAGKEGLYALDLALLRDGTTSMNGEQLAQAIDQLGATVTPTSFTAITDELPQALPLMGDMLMHPTFPAEAVEQRKAATVTTLTRAEGVAATTANRILNAILFGPDHPFGRASSPASVGAITRDDIVRFHDTNVRPQNVTLVIVGDVTPASVMPLVTRVFGSWEKTGERNLVKVRASIPSQATWVYLYDRPGAPQTTVRIGQVGPTRSSPDYVPLDMATAILGGPSGSRLSKSLREQHALTYGVTHVTQWRGWEEPSTIIGQAQVDAAKTDSALLVWMDELKGITGDRPITDKEMEFARAVTVGNMATRFETFDAIANQVASMARDHVPMTYINDYVKYVNLMPAAEVSKIAARYINPTHTAVVVVGDRKTIEIPLRAANIGPVVIVDAQGKSVP